MQLIKLQNLNLIRIKIKESENIKLPPIPTNAAEWVYWKYDVAKRVANSSSDPDGTTDWISEVEKVQDFNQLVDDYHMRQLSSKLSDAVMNTAPEDLKRRLRCFDHQMKIDTGYFPSGRQMLWWMYNYYRNTTADIYHAEIDSNWQSAVIESPC